MVCLDTFMFVVLLIFLPSDTTFNEINAVGWIFFFQAFCSKRDYWENDNNKMNFVWGNHNDHHRNKLMHLTFWSILG